MNQFSLDLISFLIIGWNETFKNNLVEFNLKGLQKDLSLIELCDVGYAKCIDNGQKFSCLKIFFLIISNSSHKSHYLIHYQALKQDVTQK